MLFLSPFTINAVLKFCKNDEVFFPTQLSIFILAFPLPKYIAKIVQI